MKSKVHSLKANVTRVFRRTLLAGTAFGPSDAVVAGQRRARSDAPYQLSCQGRARRHLWNWSFGLWFLLLSAAAAEVDRSKLPPPTARPIDFTADIKPIFEATCYRCHGAEKPKGKLSLITREAALRGGADGVDIISGDSANSRLIHYVARLVPDSEMPPEGKGEPLTREQIALLRAWIDQGVVWEKVDGAAQYAPQFSFTPALRWVTVRGNAQKFQEHQWVRRGFSGGLADFRVAQKLTNGANVVVEGHALTDDYKITLDVRKEDAGFVRFGFEQFRSYDDGHGPYYPSQAAGFATQTRNIFDLDRDLHLDRGKTFIEFGLTRPDGPRVVLGYEYQYRNGSEATEQWGPVSQRTGGTNLTRHFYPASKNIAEDVHVLRLDVAQEIAGVQFEDNARAEFWEARTKRVNDVSFRAGEVSPAAFTLTRETQDQFLFANALRGEKSVNDWLFLSAGYLFTHFDADATLQQNSVDGAGRPAARQYWSASDITLDESAHVFNVNALGGPWSGFTAAAGVQNEWSEQSGFGRPNYREGDPSDPTLGVTDHPGLVRSDTDRFSLGENIVLRYTTIPATVLFAEARWRQERSAKFEEEYGATDFLQDTDTALNWQEYKGGFRISPWRWGSLHASYLHRWHDTAFDPSRDEQPHGSPGEGYPGFIRSRSSESGIFETRLVLRPASWLKTTLSYQLSQTDYDTRTDAADTPTFQVRGGHIYAGTYDASTYSANVTVTPVRRWSLATTFSYQESRTRTADNGSASVVPYAGDIYSLTASSTYLLTERTDLTAGGNYSRARFAQHNAESGVPLGIDYDLAGLQGGVTHRFSTNLTAALQYGFYNYTEPSAHGFNDYTAHMIFGTLTMRLP